jgi:AcrR family transcriptional regulator
MRRRAVPHARGKTVVDAVLDAARAELAEMGFTALSMERVAERAGVNKTTVYRRYPTKVDLVHAALAEEKASLDLVDHGNLRDDLVNLILTAQAFMCDRRGKSIFRAVMTDPGDAELQELVQRMRRDGQREPFMLFQRAIARGELSPFVDLTVLVHAVFGTILHRVFCEQQILERREAEELVHILLHGVSPEARASAPRSRRMPRRASPRGRTHRNG